MRWGVMKRGCAVCVGLSLLVGVHSAVAEEVAYDGIIEPHVIVALGSPAEGVVSEVLVDRSSLIKKNQTLVKLESSVEWSAVEKAKAMAGFSGEVALQKAQLAFAKRTHQRMNRLKAVSAYDKDQAATDVILTEQRLKKAKEAQTMARYELKKARSVLARRTIKSPIDGVVVERYVSAGEFVSTQPLLRIAQINPLRVEVIVPAQMFGKITPGMTAKIGPELAAYGEQIAKVTLVDRVIDSASNTFGVRLELPNPEYSLPSGLRCLVTFEVEQTE